MSKQAAIWFDQQGARVFEIGSSEDEVSTTAPRRVCHAHSLDRRQSATSPDETESLFSEVARSLDGIERVLLLGASTAKLEFLQYVHRYDVALEPRIVGIETIDAGSDGRLVAYARRCFGL